MSKYRLELTEQEMTTIKYAMIDAKDSMLKSIMKSRGYWADKKTGDFISESDHCREMATDFFNLEAMYNKLYDAEEIDG